MSLSLTIVKPPLRSSNLSDLEKCPRLFFWKDLLGLRPRGSRESALDLGSIYHCYLQAKFQGKTDTQARLDCDTLWQTMVKALDEAADDELGLLPTGQTLEAAISSLSDDYYKGMAMGAVFMSFAPFNWDEWEILEGPDGEKCVELMLDYPIPGMKTRGRSPCDLILVKKDKAPREGIRPLREVWIVDHKTTSMDPEVRVKTVGLSPQLQLYRLGVLDLLERWGYKDHQLVGTIHTAIKKPTIKYCPNGKDSDGFDHYIQRLIEWYEKKMKDENEPNPIILAFNRFKGDPMGVEFASRLDRWEQVVEADSTDPSDYYRAGDTVCLDYNRVCPYLKLCTSSEAMWPDLIQSYYEVKRREELEDVKEE